MWIDSIKSSSSKSSIRNGLAYYSQNRVKLLPGDDTDFIEADVEGSDKYEVVLDISRKKNSWKILSDCSCPYTLDHFAPCKHVWATLYAAHFQGRLTGSPGSVRLEFVEPSEDDFDDVFDDDEDEDFSGTGRYGNALPGNFSTRFVEPKPTRKQAHSTKAPTWNRLIHSLAAQSMGQRPNVAGTAGLIEPYYVLIPDGSADSNRMEIELVQRARLKNGTPGKPKMLSLSSKMIPLLPTELDRRICLMLVGASAAQSADYRYSSYSYGYSYYGSRFSSFVLPDSAAAEFVDMMADTGRFYVRSSLDGEMTPLQVDRDGPWEAALTVRPAGKRDFEIAPVFRRNGAYHDLADARAIFAGEPGHALFDNVLRRVRPSASGLWQARPKPARVAEREKSALLKALASAKELPPIEWPDSWGIVTVTDIPPKPVLELKLEDSSRPGASRFALASISMEYEGRRVSTEDTSRLLIEPEQSRQIVRNREREIELARRPSELGLEQSAYDGPRIPTKRVPSVVLQLLEEGWEVTGNRALFRKAGDFSIETTSGIDWFDMNGHVDFGGVTVDLPELLAAFRKGEKFVKLGDGSMGMLPEQWLARHGALLDLGQAKGDAIRFAKTQIAVIDALLAELPEATFDKSIAGAREKLRSFSGVSARAACKNFRGTLRPYQEAGLGWLEFLADFGWGGCLADDMGLGKTVQVLARLAEIHAGRKKAPSLAVVPKSLIFNWMREAERFAPQLRVLDYTGIDRKIAAPDFKQFDLVLTTYGTLRRDIEELRRQEFTHVILDEAQAIKNPASQSAKAVRLLRGEHRLAMTGTPVENHLGDLWSIVDFLNPGMLGSYAGFKSGFLAKNGDGQDDRLKLLHRMMRPFILRRTKELVAPELPKRSEQVLDCVMSPAQKKHYDELRDYYRASLLGRIEKDGIARSKIHVLEALLRLRQAACHPALVDPAKMNADSAKLDMLLPMLDELASEGHKALVFSQFTSMLAIVRKKLDKERVVYEYLDGSTTDRRKRVDRFQTDENCRLFLISLKAGGVGLNLTAADYVFILDPWWNPAVEAQAIDRTHRIGQDKHVIAYRLITKDTVESRILELQKSKRELAGAIVTEANSLISQLSREDLAMLLG